MPPIADFIKQRAEWKTLPALMLLVISVSALRASTLDGIGLTALRTVATNVDGTGIRVAQVEASLSTNSPIWEVNPADVGQPTGLFTYTSSNGTSTTYPNALGTNSWHAENVGNDFYGQPYGVATNLARVDVYEANYFLAHDVEVPIPPNPGAAIVNQSFTFGPLTVADQQTIDSDYDNAAAQNKTLFVSAVDNGGNVHAPGTSYNGLGVAAYGPNAQSSVGPTLDNGRCKPDLTAPSPDYTSFSTPVVAGAAAVLLQVAGRGDGGNDTNSAADLRTIKALLLNGAVKPLGWTNSSTTPLDARYGAGVVNLLNAYEQLAGGKHTNITTSTVSLNAAHPPTGATGTVSALSGWNFAINTSGVSSDSVQHYYFNLSNTLAAVKFTATATLVWNRQQNQTNINNLNLFLYNCANSNLVACSTSLVDNVEHLYLTNLAQGRYDLQAWKAGGVPSVNIVSAAEPYALAWEFMPPPTLALAGGMNPALAWPVYPAGFLVEARTNLLADVWNTNGISAFTITHGTNSLNLNTTNAAQFFRLRKPNL